MEDANGIKSNVYETDVKTDTYVIPKVVSVSHTSTLNSISLTVSASKGSNNIVSYLYSKDNGITYEESTSNTYTFNGLNEKTNYPIKVVAVDTNNRESVVYTTTATTDAYKLPTINNVTLSSTSSSITLNVSGTNGDGTITEYYYSKDGGSTYTKSASTSHTFSGLTGNTTFYVKVYVKDSNGKQSSVWSGSIATKQSILLANYIKSKYTSQGAGGLYLHDAGLANGANDNSYRYAGANPNNYVCFGSTAKPCPIDNLYRIIGVFGNQVKLVKYDYATVNQLGTSANYVNNYQASGNNLANYKGNQNLSNIGSYYWNGISDENDWSISNLNIINMNRNYFNKIGTLWTNKISSFAWKVGGVDYSTVENNVASYVYKNEILNANITYNAKIGLMYVSDYGYAADPSAWTKNLSSYGNSTITSVNWLYMGLYEWTITPQTDFTSSSFDAFCIINTGVVYGVDVSSDSAVRPTFYLNSNVSYTSGTETQDNPIIIIIIST